MVAYSFKAQFAEPIEQRHKCQTIRADRKRHARPGERVQLYVGMRTRQCRKIIPDPVCTEIQSVVIWVSRHHIMRIMVEGKDLTALNMEGFAQDDGFASLEEMHKFWLVNHGAINFKGIIVKWKDQP